LNVDIEELARRLGDETLIVLDVRTEAEYSGARGNACDPRQGHIPGARNLDVAELARCETAEDVQALVDLPPGSELAAYCHSGSRSALAVQILTVAGFEARNYAGSWHEWSRRDDLPFET
jgi:thiosulfate/3-mercaptopyruvate sulfurtransferase